MGPEDPGCPFRVQGHDAHPLGAVCENSPVSCGVRAPEVRAAAQGRGWQAAKRPRRAGQAASGRTAASQPLTWDFEGDMNSSVAGVPLLLMNADMCGQPGRGLTCPGDVQLEYFNNQEHSGVFPQGNLAAPAPSAQQGFVCLTSTFLETS